MTIFGTLKVHFLKLSSHEALKGKATLNLCSHILFIVISMLHTNVNKVQIKRDNGENIENMPVMGALTIHQLSAPVWAVTTSHFYVTGSIHT